MRNGEKVNRFDPSWVKNPRIKAREVLGISEGSYSISKKLTIAAEKECPKTSIHLYNELAKFLRSLSLPLIVIGIYNIIAS